MARLKDHLGTEFATLNFQGDVRNFCTQYQDIDIAGLKLTPAISDELMIAQRNGKNVFDSENDERSLILKNNEKILSENIKTEQLPELELSKLKDYLSNLDSEVIYELNALQSVDEMYVSLVILAQIYRPDVDIIVDSIISDVFNFVSTYLYRSGIKDIISSTDDFLVMYKNRLYPVVIKEKNMDDKFYVHGLGEHTWRQFLDMYAVIPSYFGKIRISKSEYKPHWEELITTCIELIKTKLDHRRITLDDFLGGALS